jgi:hypothetical protein
MNIDIKKVGVHVPRVLSTITQKGGGPCPKGAFNMLYLSHGVPMLYSMALAWGFLVVRLRVATPRLVHLFKREPPIYIISTSTYAEDTQCSFMEPCVGNVILGYRLLFVMCSSFARRNTVMFVICSSGVRLLVFVCSLLVCPT